MLGSDKTFTLPEFLIAPELSKMLGANGLEHLSDAYESIDFDWSEVLFFDDYTLLKLIFIQRYLRSVDKKIKNRGFAFVKLSQNRQAVLRQLWSVGLPELIASGHLFETSKLKDVLKDESQLLESDPFFGLNNSAMPTSVIPMLCCHDLKYFKPGSREEKQLDSFIRTGLRPHANRTLAWDLIESRDFRHLMLQQLRRNVEEHSHFENHSATGIALVRVWTHNTLTKEWRLTEKAINRLLELWGKDPVFSSFGRMINKDNGILQISVLDDGIGIPNTLKSVHDSLLEEYGQERLFRLRYSLEQFDKRFEEPASWADEKARLIAFSTDERGTCKPDRPAEIKGLEYLRKYAVIAKHGAICIESDGSGISHITPEHSYGEPFNYGLQWCKIGGTGVLLVVPMSVIESRVDSKKLLIPSVEHGVSAYKTSYAKRLRIRDHLITQNSITNDLDIGRKNIIQCTTGILTELTLKDVEDDVKNLRQRGLFIIDFSGLPDSKKLFHFLFTYLAEGLSALDPRQISPFVFANLPKGLCGLLGRAISRYSASDKRLPIFAFAAEQVEPFWLGLEEDNKIPGYLHPQLSCQIRRKITDHSENMTEAFFRECLTKLLCSSKPIQISHSSVLACINFNSRDTLLKSPVFLELETIVRKSSLYRESSQRSHADGEVQYSKRFQPVFLLEEIVAEVRGLFLDKFRSVLTNPPVCFRPTNDNEGIRLPHSSRISARYFRSDALVDSPIAMELTQEIVAIAFSLLKQMPTGRLDWVVSCTSPLHWFVHRVVDGLADYGMICSHFVFPSYEDIPTSIETIQMHKGENVLALTDVIAGAETSYRMAESLINHFEVNMVGLIAFADIRTSEIRKNGPNIDKIYNGRIVCLYNDEEPDRRDDLIPAYYVHPETVVPKKDITKGPEKEFFHANYAGTGPLIENHAYFKSPERTLDLIKSMGALKYGHFQHGTHHSEIFVDVETILSSPQYLNLIVSALFRYIVNNDIRLVLYPSHSSSYMIADELKQRSENAPVDFIMACRTFRGVQGTSYALTRVSPHPEPKWEHLSSNPVLILDDAVCSGETVRSIITELVRIHRNYYTGQGPLYPEDLESKFSVHIVAFLSRLPRITGDFWRGLSTIAAGRIQFSAFISMPLAAHSDEFCPQCRLEHRLSTAKKSTEYCLYAKEFMSWWISQISLISSHERRHITIKRDEHFSSEEVLKLSGYLSAIERGAYQSLSKALFGKPGKPAKESSISVISHVRSRAAFLHDLLPESSNNDDRVLLRSKELEDLIDLSLNQRGSLKHERIVLEILQVLTLRYLRMRPSKNEFKSIFKCLFNKLSGSFDNRLIVGGIASVLDSCLRRFESRERTALCENLHNRMQNFSKQGFNEKANLIFDWFFMYLTEGGKNIDCVGKAVRLLAEFAKKGRSNHFYGRHELDELHDFFNNPSSQNEANQATEAVRRALFSTDRFIDLVTATRVLQSACPMDRGELEQLQKRTENNALDLRKICDAYIDAENTRDTFEDYKKIKALYLRTYNDWFPIEIQEPPKAAKIISHFTPNLHNHLISAWGSFVPQRLNKGDIKMDMSDVYRHKYLKVLIDPTVLITGMNQIWDNIDKQAQENTSVSILCEICSSDNRHIDAPTRLLIADGKVGLRISNNNTFRPNPDQIKLSGLYDLRIRLSEYGGDLVYTIPKTRFSFQVMIILPIWTEVTK